MLFNQQSGGTRANGAPTSFEGRMWSEKNCRLFCVFSCEPLNRKNPRCACCPQQITSPILKRFPHFWVQHHGLLLHANLTKGLHWEWFAKFSRYGAGERQTIFKIGLALATQRTCCLDASLSENYSNHTSSHHSVFSHSAQCRPILFSFQTPFLNGSFMPTLQSWSVGALKMLRSSLLERCFNRLLDQQW